MATPSADSSVPDSGELFGRYKERLRRTVRLRLDRRLVGVVDSSGVLKLVREEAARRGEELAAPAAPQSVSVAAPGDGRSAGTVAPGPAGS